MNRTLTFDEVHRIRTQDHPDTFWANALGVSKNCVQKARTGVSWKKHPTPPDTKVRIRNQHGEHARPETRAVRRVGVDEQVLSRALARWPRVEVG